ncbi:fumarylacetoacetate hydrolase family protein [Pseudonocardia sp.]|uniref:fumarylacetoacetate hydrolase family protein n=1 Tax=Pseudonocardia sp. TaxID=60912 RepID=UPI0031FE3E59
MRIANLDHRLVLLAGDGCIDVATASQGRFSADPQAVYTDWDAFTTWAAAVDPGSAQPYDAAQLGAPTPAPGQIFAIGLNYADHAGESGFTAPAEPAVFTKFASSITGPYATVALPASTVDWEVELVAVIGRPAYRVDASRAWDHVAGLTVGQDLSERTRQLVPPAPQFSLGKSFPGFAPIGPWVVTADELADRDNLELGCSINGEQVQKGRTADLLFSVPALIERLSAVLPLAPGDIIFTGTPSGVGHARTPQRYISAGDALTSWVEGIGEIRITFIDGPRYIPSAGSEEH